MTTTTQTPERQISTQRRPVWKHGLAAAVVASAATTALAAITSATGTTFADRTGAGIPLIGFPELTLLFSMIGVGMAAVIERKARRPRLVFLRTAVVLTALSYVPDLVSGFSTRSAVTLIVLHTVAAAIVVPTLARRLSDVAPVAREMQTVREA